MDTAHHDCSEGSLQNNRESRDQAPQENKTTELDKAKFLWGEYRYRHELCWKLLFQITTAVVIVLVIPYVRPDIAQRLSWATLFLPVLAFALLRLSLRRMQGELQILDRIRSKHRELQKELFNIPNEASNFSKDVSRYLRGLAVVSIIDFVVLTWLTWKQH